MQESKDEISFLSTEAIMEKVAFAIEEQNY